MAVNYAPDSGYAKEMWKWDHPQGMRHPSDPTITGMRPNEKQEFPKMLYRGYRTDNGPVKLEQFIVHDSLEQDNQYSRGWHPTQEAALDAFHAADREVAKLAAERHHEVRSMSDRARAEVEAIEAESDDHLPTIPEAPIKRRGRPKKLETV